MKIPCFLHVNEILNYELTHQFNVKENTTVLHFIYSTKAMRCLLILLLLIQKQTSKRISISTECIVLLGVKFRPVAHKLCQ